MLATMIYLMRGTHYVYQGEEIAMKTPILRTFPNIRTLKASTILKYLKMMEYLRMKFTKFSAAAQGTTQELQCSGTKAKTQASPQAHHGLR